MRVLTKDTDVDLVKYLHTLPDLTVSDRNRILEVYAHAGVWCVSNRVCSMYFRLEKDARDFEANCGLAAGLEVFHISVC